MHRRIYMIETKEA